MGKLLIILLLCLPALSYGQGYSAIGNTNPTDTARVLNNWFMPVKGMRFPFYATTDSNFLLLRPGSGYAVSYSMSQLISRINSAIGGTPTWQQTLIGAGAVLSQDNAINGAGKTLVFENSKILGLGAQDSLIIRSTVNKIYGIDSLKGIAYYTNLNTPATDYEIPSWGAVRSLQSASSFDTTMSATVTSLTSLRFSRTVESIICDCGITYNSSWFAQVADTITFLNGLKFYNGNKLTIILR